MQARRAILLWAVPLLLVSGDALAWGLQTHTYFAQLLLWAVPLADPRFRRAVARFPRLALAGACLPDLSLMGNHLRTAAFHGNHRWCTAARLLERARDDDGRALAVGYASHLLVDVIAHNHFVPSHERLWIKLPVLTHAFSEWAMDAHVRGQLLDTPAALMRDESDRLARYVAANFDLAPQLAARAVAALARAENTLRVSRLPDALHLTARTLDGKLAARFDYYIAQTAARLAQINRVLAGNRPVWNAEVRGSGPVRSVRALPEMRLRLGLPLPEDLFCPETRLAHAEGSD